jgi:ABC-type amino acid transport substrate-binding protein
MGPASHSGRLRTLGAAATVLLALAGAGAALEPPGVLRVVAPFDREFAFVAKEPAPPDAPGFDVEILQGFARLRGLRLELSYSTSWDGAIPLLLEHKADLIAGGYSDTPERRRKVDFTVGVFPSRDVALNRKPMQPVTTLEELRKSDVLTYRGSSMAESVAAAGVPAERLTLMETGDIEKLMRTEKQRSVGVVGLEVAILARQRDPQFQLGVYLGEPSSLAYGVRKDDVELRKNLDAYLSNLRRTPTWSRLVVKYFGAAALDILKSARAPG